MRRSFVNAVILSFSVACSSDPDDLEQGNTAGTGSQEGTDSLSTGIEASSELAVTGTGGTTDPSLPLEEELPEVKTFFTLPEAFVAAEGATSGTDTASLAGGYRWVGPLNEVDVEPNAECANILRVVVRDFEPTHVDFGAPKEVNAVGMVGALGAALGDDRKPVRIASVFPDTALKMDEWYRHGDAVENVPHVVDLWLEPFDDENGVQTFVFDSSRFFPLGAEGVTTNADLDAVQRNFGFTTELHTRFEYKGGEHFSFRGDDDVFVYIDKKLVVDLGGVHNPQSGEVAVDSLGLVVGEVYELDLFQAERNPTGSNFRLETSLDFTECGEILPADIVIR